MTKHTPTPWRVVIHPNAWSIQGHNKFPAPVAMQYADSDKSNASHIVHCVNTHDQLVGLLNKLSDLVTYTRFSDVDGNHYRITVSDDEFSLFMDEVSAVLLEDSDKAGK